MGLQEIKADARVLGERLQKMPIVDIDFRHELTENVLPLFEGLCNALEEEVVVRVDDLEEAIDELMDQSTDVLHPETSAKIIGVVEFGKQLATELEQLIAKGKLDDLTKKRVKDLVKTYRQGAQIVTDIVTEITIPLDEVEPPEDDDEEEGGEGGNDESQPDAPDAPDADEDQDDIAAEGDE